MKFKRLAAVCTALLMALLCACSVPADSDSAPVSQQKAKDGELAVHFLDVGQGDSEFIELPGGETMLIDAGEQEYGKTVSDYISSLGYSEITYLVATHPHSDHIGGLPAGLDTFDVLNVYLPDADSSSAIYSSFLDKVDAEGCTVSQAAQSVSVIADGEVTAQFLAPCSPDPDDLNNASAVLKLTYGEVSLLVMCDAEEVSEQKSTADVSADVVKVGTHGSDTSSSQGCKPRFSAVRCDRGRRGECLQSSKRRCCCTLAECGRAGAAHGSSWQYCDPLRRHGSIRCRFFRCCQRNNRGGRRGFYTDDRCGGKRRIKGRAVYVCAEHVLQKDPHAGLFRCFVHGRQQ